ncbi:MAG: hypothetical protein E7112_00285 [Bacteroidales bacterium]|mgnify:FL=1|nr:hypothetical protein [Bacteroidales bacterium]
MRPRIFIGSSKEGLYIAGQIKAYFSKDFDCYLWSDDIFKYNDNYLETLMKEASLFDFGFMVCTNDDWTKSRGVEQGAPRDNVIFEYGLFLGRLGRERAYIIHDKSIKLPSDLHGITLASFEVNDGVITSHDKPFEVLLERLHNEIVGKIEIGLLGMLPSTVLAIGYFENFVKPVCEYLTIHETIDVDGEHCHCSKFKVVIPRDLDADIKKRALIYHRKQSYKELQIPTDSRSYPLYVSIEKEGSEVVLSDMPTTLNGIDKAIDMYLRKGHIGKTQEQQLLEDRELRNFTMVLSKLVANDAFCKEIICIETEKL